MEKIKTDDALILLKELVDWNFSEDVQGWMGLAALRFPYPEGKSEKAGAMWDRAKSFVESQKEVPATVDDDTLGMLATIRSYLKNSGLNYKIEYRRKKSGYYILTNKTGTILESGNPGDIQRYIEDYLKLMGHK